MRHVGVVASLVLVASELAACRGRPGAVPPAVSRSVPMHVRAFATVVAAEDATGISVGDHVDVIISVPYPDAGMTTVPLLVNLPVFAISVDPSRDRAVVTLLVLPEESAMLADAEAAGHLSLVVRNPKDPDEGRRSDGRWPKATDRELLDPGD